MSGAFTLKSKENTLKTIVGVTGKNGTRYCERCKTYKPHNKSKAVKPWVCFDCKPRLVNK